MNRRSHDPDREHSADYREYIDSDAWQATREEAFRVHGRACQRCGETEGLSVHHLHYETLGREDVAKDLRVLCTPCHEQADRARARETERRGADALYRARLHGWASRRYGYDWWLSMDESEVAEEFDEWLEDHDGD